jgi:hypothetical protein
MTEIPTGKAPSVSAHLLRESKVMSHIVQIATQVRDPIAVRAAAARLSLPEPTFGSVRLFNAEATGWKVQFPAWKYPAVCDTSSGIVYHDNYQGRWGDPTHLEKFLQSYAVEKARLEARKAGHTVIEQTLANGFVKLTVQVGAAA